ncbi:MAG: phosphatidate cytidylyltransferase [Rhodospirillales bacterium]
MARREGDPAADGLAARVGSAVVLVPVVLAAVHLGTPVFDGLVGIAALVLAWEWNRLCGGRLGWLAVGFLAIALPCVSLLYLRGDPAAGAETLFWLLAVVWSADTGAFAFGRLIGGPRLAPVISPNKTWSGLIGGIASAGAMGGATALVLGLDGVMALAGWSAAIGAISQGGDLTESWVKRHFGVKDTGNIVPGHGGLLDRVDGLLAAAIAVAVVTAAGKGSILTWT